VGQVTVRRGGEGRGREGAVVQWEHPIYPLHIDGAEARNETQFRVDFIETHVTVPDLDEIGTLRRFQHLRLSKNRA